MSASHLSLGGARVAEGRHQWREGLLDLAQALEEPRTVNPCGVARAVVLLTCGTGPLFTPAAEGPIGEAISWVADGLHTRALSTGTPW